MTDKIFISGDEKDFNGVRGGGVSYLLVIRLGGSSVDDLIFFGVLTEVCF